ncbi:MAG: YceD family protein [Desulfobaccales bacterium]
MKTHKTLQISVKSIPETGKEVILTLGKEWFDRWRQEDPGLEFAQGNIRGAVTLAKHGQDILIRGSLEGSLGLSCGRCLEPFAAPVATEFELLLLPAPASESPDEEELSARELDLDVYTGETVDLEALVREQIILLVPLKPLCQEDCRGLCPSCGANLNRETCPCREGSLQQSAISHQQKTKG